MRDAVDDFLVWVLVGVMAGLLACILMFVGVKAAGAQETCESGSFGCEHGLMHDHYKDWRSGSGVSCCNDADCRPGRAKFENGAWLVYIPEYKQWLAVPPEKVQEPDKFKDGRNHFCTADPQNWVKSREPMETLPVYCFSPATNKS